MTKVKRIIAAALTVASMGTIGTTSFAATSENTYHFFDFNIGMRNDTDRSTTVEKDNSYSFAVVVIDDGTISGSNNITFYVNDAVTNTTVTDSHYATGYESFVLNYNSGEGDTGDFYYLEGKTGYYSATAGGMWDA